MYTKPDTSSNPRVDPGIVWTLWPLQLMENVEFYCQALPQPPIPSPRPPGQLDPETPWSPQTQQAHLEAIVNHQIEAPGPPITQDLGHLSPCPTAHYQKEHSSPFPREFGLQLDLPGFMSNGSQCLSSDLHWQGWPTHGGPLVSKSLHLALMLKPTPYMPPHLPGTRRLWMPCIAMYVLSLPSQTGIPSPHCLLVQNLINPHGELEESDEGAD